MRRDIPKDVLQAMLALRQGYHIGVDGVVQHLDGRTIKTLWVEIDNIFDQCGLKPIPTEAYCMFANHTFLGRDNDVLLAGALENLSENYTPEIVRSSTRCKGIQRGAEESREDFIQRAAAWLRSDDA